jgi:glycosyltransferase involved in cell wall biosynthesis
VVGPHHNQPARWLRRQRSGTRPGPTAVTVVIPCYNETQSLRYLQKTLDSLKQAFAGEYHFAFLFVDDCSTDGTWAMLQELFGGREDCTFVRHDTNQGIAAAIQTGLRHARTSIACSIDCDCTYDPHELGGMIPLLVDGVDVVTASPYHPQGNVRNVPRWRLALSKTLSRLYRLLLRQKLFTYTSCFRVYRRESAIACQVRRSGFLGIAELIARLDLAGRRVVEYPTTLEVRVLGQSKMKVLRTIVGHLGLLTDVLRARLSGSNPSDSALA